MDTDYFDYVDARGPKRSSHFAYRGITEPEAVYIRRTGTIRSNESYCVLHEGTCFADGFADAVSYVTYGRDNPGRTGKPVYVIEVRRGPEIVVDRRDGYPKSSKAISADRITRAWRFEPKAVVEMSGEEFLQMG